MSSDAEPGEDHHMYQFQNRMGQDRHLQNIIDHTNTLFPDRRYQLSQLNPLGGANGNGMFMNQLGNFQDDDQDLDIFDRNLLGHSQRFFHPPNSERREPRLSLPNTNTPNQSRRGVGDASHHFRPIPMRDFSHRSPFSNDLALIGGIEPSPASQSILNRDGSRRIGELQPGAQVVTPPFYSASSQIPSLESPFTSSSPTLVGGSSPSTRLSLKQAAKVNGNPLVKQKKASNLKLTLEHAPDEPPVLNGTRLINPGEVLPDKFRTVFPYELFNVIQSKCFPLVYGTNDNVVVSAPTGSGKTAILEMAICKLIMAPGSDNAKIVYQAPTKSLCSERAKDWEKKFSHMNIRCVELTGDTSQAQASRVGNASIIVTTPEKWDSITRKWSDHRKLLEMVRLVLIDEVHILKDARGATLEAVVSRMKTIGANVRFVALSATIPNIGDIARWLGRDYSNQQEPARAEAFGEELRPVKLQRYVYGYGSYQNDFIFDKSLDGKLIMLLSKHSQKKPIMIFCFTRKSCEVTARRLVEWWSTCKAEDKAWPAPTRRVPVINTSLQEIVRHGVAFHHAGLDAQDRSAVAQNFLEGQIHVICCTSTLAVGVNLPCHTVVLKGTTGYTDDKAQEYSDLEVMQMLGRAGRPQFDDSAVAIIMTKTANVDRYKKMMSGEETLESTLHRNLVEHLNSEISLGTIQDVQTAKKWIGGTFLSVRVRQSPSLYHLQDARNAEDADKRMEEWCERDVKLLQECGLITKQAPFKCTEYGHAMSRYMINIETMKLLLSMPRGAGLEEILTTLCKAAELKDFRFKPDERALFRELNKSPFILHPIKETVNQNWHKVFLVAQVFLGGVELPHEKGSGLMKFKIGAEKSAIFDRLNRLVRCFVDCRVFDGDGYSTKAGLELARALSANSWDNKPSQLSQIPGLGPVMIRKWVSNGVHTVLGLADRDFNEIERVSSRNPPYGMNMLKTLENFPRLDMKTHLVASIPRQSQPEDSVTVTLKVNLCYRNAKGVPIWNHKVPAATFFVLTTDGCLAYFWRGNLRKIEKSTGLDLKFPVSLSGPDQKVSCYFGCEEIVGTQVVKELDPDIPKTAWKERKAQVINCQAPATILDDDMDYDDLSDEEILSATLALANGADEMGSSEYPGPLDDAEEEYPLIDHVLSQEASLSTFEPAKMDNGKWMCNHRCRNGGSTSSGKPCTHKCCHEGINRFRPPPQDKKKKKNQKEVGNNVPKEEDSTSGFSTQQAQVSGAAGDIKTNKDRGKGVARPATNHISQQRHTTTGQPMAGKSDANLPNVKRKRSAEANKGAMLKKRSKTKEHTSDIDALSDIECIDLSTMSPETETEHLPSLTLGTHGMKKSQRPFDMPKGVVNSTLPVMSAFSGHGEPKLSNSLFSGALGAHDGVCANMRYDSDMQYDSDVFENDDELPDIESIIRLSKSKDVSKLQTMRKDETLYPGVVETLKESMDSGRSPNLSFTTVNELQKASDRFDLPSASLSGQETYLLSGSTEWKPTKMGSSSPWLESLENSSGITPASTALEPLARQPLPIDSGPSEACENEELSSDCDSNEPNWLSEFDPALINSLRGCANFVD
ncbi:P-loop containing nucleoside triphosphate hydrolase protein [Hypoxylon trugodes]|uniref:P-loop containing nucleoside triphosphate hydrolase protein n=1 Tax=Hypoxylon trugodes TaxID=326681 RepID=UPI00219297A8|nr:P-loop containing nucleoside triphosphate hydrolase protein [Hypoxylon trugodes]KAI1387190.1 P-loop containing nucleoside triphosphate hydrolase protein [Hypoxylon trugodes]